MKRRFTIMVVNPHTQTCQEKARRFFGPKQDVASWFFDYVKRYHPNATEYYNKHHLYNPEFHDGENIIRLV